MIPWAIYFIACAYITYVLRSFVSDRYKLLFIVCVMTVLLTPAAIESDSWRLAPSLSIFLYNLILEKYLSFRSLKPILISLPISLLGFWIFIVIKKRFF